jgi:hypothetical protein
MACLRPAPGAGDSTAPVPIRGWRRRLTSLLRRLGSGRGRTGADYARLHKRLGSELLPLDRLLSAAGLLRPAVAFAVYKKRPEGQPDG